MCKCENEKEKVRKNIARIYEKNKSERSKKLRTCIKRSKVNTGYVLLVGRKLKSWESLLCSIFLRSLASHADVLRAL